MTADLATVETEEPTLWGLTVRQIHDRFWAARGVQVVRRSERSEIVEGADLFLLTDPRVLVRFPLRDLVETLSWLRPDLLVLRINDVRDRGYREVAESDEDGRLLGFGRIYGGPNSRMARMALTPDPDIARRWQNADNPRAAWRMLRKIPPSLRTVRTIPGHIYDGRDDHETMDCLRELVARWASPDSTIRRATSAGRGVFVDRSSELHRDAKVLGNLWIGAGRNVSADTTVVGPSVLWDDEEQRPEPEGIEWLELEPKRDFAPPATGTVTRGFIARSTKRLFDILFSLVVLAFTLPLYPIIALAILIEDGWPIFFAHRRETLGGKEFPCIKFRSMRKDAEELKARLAEENQADGPQFFMEDDPRLTKSGKFLRNTQLDEIPQFINVLLGHMSVVGPRPSPRSENQFCPGWREARLSVRPGVTGLWQIKRTRQKGLDFQEWIRFDIEYVEKASPWLDLWIIWQTVLMLVRGKD